MAVSLVYVLWFACRRSRRRADASAQPAEPSGDERLERRLDCLAILAKPLPRR
jgi:hypothetical protein